MTCLDHGLAASFQRDQIAHLRMGLSCLDVSIYRGRRAISRRANGAPAGTATGLLCLDVRAYRARNSISRRAKGAPAGTATGLLCLDVSRCKGGKGIFLYFQAGQVRTCACACAAAWESAVAAACAAACVSGAGLACVCEGKGARDAPILQHILVYTGKKKGSE